MRGLVTRRRECRLLRRGCPGLKRSCRCSQHKRAQVQCRHVSPSTGSDFVFRISCTPSGQVLIQAPSSQRSVEKTLRDAAGRTRKDQDRVANQVGHLPTAHDQTLHLKVPHSLRVRVSDAGFAEFLRYQCYRGGCLPGFLQATSCTRDLGGVSSPFMGKYLRPP